MSLPPIKAPARRGIDPEAARALAESEGLGIPMTPEGMPRPSAHRRADPVADGPRPKRPAGVESFQADFPSELLDELRIRAIRERTSAKALVLRALHGAGYPVPGEFLEDKRRRGR